MDFDTKTLYVYYIEIICKNIAIFFSQTLIISHVQAKSENIFTAHPYMHTMNTHLALLYSKVKLENNNSVKWIKITHNGPGRSK